MANLELVTKNGGIANAFSDSIIYHSIFGDDNRALTRGVIFNGIGSSLSAFVDQSGKKITIGTGMGALYGRQFEIVSPIEFDLSALTGIKYCLIYIEVSTKNVTAQTAKLKLAYDSGGYPTIPNADIYSSELGIAVMPIWRFILTTTSSTPISALTKLFFGKNPGQVFKTKSLQARSFIFNNKVSEIQDPGKDYWLKSRNADLATTSARFGGHLFDASLNIDSSCQAFAIADTQKITSDQHTTNDGVSGSCWQDGDDVSYKLYDLTPSNSQAKISGWMVYMKLSTAKFNWGFLGLGSHWEYDVKDWVTSFIIPKSGPTIYLAQDALNHSIYVKNDPPEAGIQILTIVLPSFLCRQLTVLGLKINFYPKAEIICKSSYRTYGEIHLTPLLNLI